MSHRSRGPEGSCTHRSVGRLISPASTLRPAVGVGLADDSVRTQEITMKRIIGAIVVAAAFVVVQAYPARAQSVPDPDKNFMIEAARGGIAEVELGRIATQRGATEPVRQFGQRMVTDHGVANQELMQLAQSKGVTLPQEMDAAHRAVADRLMTLSGAAFDHAYM